MEQKEIIENGRKYKAYVSPEPDTPGAYIIIGPPEGLVDGLGLPESVATKLHNILYERGIFTYSDAAKKNVLIGVIQEVYLLEAQALLEKFSQYEKETV